MPHSARIDAHQHFWHYQPDAYPWIDDAMAALRRDFLPADLELEMDAVNVTCSIAVQARQTIEETRWLLGLADAHDFIAGVIGWVDLQADDLDAQLEVVARHPKLLGVRHVAQSEPAGFMARPALRRGIARLERFGLTYDLLVYAAQLPEATALVEACPRQRFVLDHLGKPDIKGGGFAGWRRDLQAIAAFPHVWCKLSGLVTEADRYSWTPAALRPYIETALDVFGPDRLMIGSDWPVCTVAAGYGDTLAAIEGALEDCSKDERARVLGGTAQQLWNL